MKLKDPDMFKPAWWTMHSNFRVNGTAGGEAMQHSVEVSFPVKENDKGELVIANHSDLEIRHTGHNDPDWRRKISGMFGVEVALATELAGHLFCPTTGKKVSVGRIDGNPALWCDAEYKTAMRCLGLKYETADGPPISADAKIAYSVLNPKAVDVFIGRLMPILREAKLKCALLELKPEYNRGAMLNLIRTIHTGKHIVDTDFGQHPNVLLPIMAWGLDQVTRDKEFFEFIKDLCSDHYTSTYLEYRV